MVATSFVYVTAETIAEAKTLARALVSERIAACANIIPAVTSVYWWQGSLQETEEVGLILKTRSECVEQLTERLRALHSYSCPCVVALPIAAGNPDFLKWIEDETVSPAGD
jgi:periplasmic divalent cation tolerance protein